MDADRNQIPPRFNPPLQIITHALEPGQITWAITGSLGFALQGIAVAVHDIDIQTDQAGAYEIERRLQRYSIEPVTRRTSERLQSHFGAFLIADIRVEIMGALQKRKPDGSWDAPVQVLPLRCWVETQGMHLPVLSLAYEYQAYQYLGRTEKVRLLAKHLNITGENPHDRTNRPPRTH